MGLTLTNVGYTYSADTTFASRALVDVSLEVSAGELVLVLGATGSGKSTLLKLAAGLVPATSGTLSIDGMPLSRKSARGSVGLAFQDAEAQLFAETVLDDVMFGPRNLGANQPDARGAAESALRAVGLDPAEFGARSPFTLSGGEARRVAIAGVLAMRPSYLLLDEPTSGLDARGRAAVLDLIAEARRRCGVVVVSHSAEEFLGLADKVVILTSGECLFAGDAGRLIDSPKLFEDAGLIAPDVVRVQALLRAAGHGIGEYTLIPAAAAAGIAAALGRA